MDKTPQIAEEKHVVTMDKAQKNKALKIQKLVFCCFLLTSAKAKTFQDGDRLKRFYTTISLQLRRFSKIATIVYQKDSRSFQQWVQQEAKRSILQDYEVTDTQTDTRTDRQKHTHTHTQTDCYNPPPTLRLIMCHCIIGTPLNQLLMND